MFLTLKPTCTNDVKEEQLILRLSQDITKGIRNNLKITIKAWNYTNSKQ